MNNEKKMFRGVFIFIALIIAIAFAFPAKRKTYQLQTPSFNAQASTTLFFKNTRAYYYALEEMPEAGFDVYRFSKTMQADTLPFVNMILVHNWRLDEVYIITEPNEAFLNLGKVPVFLGDSAVVFDKLSMNNIEQYQFGAAVFKALLDEKSIYFGANRDLFFGTAENEQANFMVLKDYFKWVYKYR